MITQKYLLDVLDRTDELEKRGHLQAGYSKDFSKQIIKLVEIVPPFELKSSMTNLENEIKQKLTEMESKIKNLKAKKMRKQVCKKAQKCLERHWHKPPTSFGKFTRKIEQFY